MPTTAGLHVPVTPLVEVAGSSGTVPPAQIDRAVPKLNVVVVMLLTVTVKLVTSAHCPASGVKV